MSISAPPSGRTVVREDSPLSALQACGWRRMQVLPVVVDPGRTADVVAAETGPGADQNLQRTQCGSVPDRAAPRPAMLTRGSPRPSPLQRLQRTAWS